MKLSMAVGVSLFGVFGFIYLSSCVSWEVIESFQLVSVTGLLTCWRKYSTTASFTSTPTSTNILFIHSTYDRSNSFVDKACQEFCGDKDELETLKHMVDRATAWVAANMNIPETSRWRALRNNETLNELLINLASTVASEESLYVDVAEAGVSGGDNPLSRKRQRVLCIDAW